jgi:alpha-tubulin suppressor-like RCC1 family protein
VPVEVSGLSSVTAIAAGGWSGYALRADGSVWDWGYGTDGELGNAATDGSALPVQVSTPAPAAGIAAGAFTGYVLMRS